MRYPLQHRSAVLLIALLASLLVASFAAVEAASRGTNFENFTPGTVDGQDGWSSFGTAGRGCGVYDHYVVDNVGAPASFGARSLRISNAVTSGCFGDQTFSHSVADEAGETSAQSGGLSGGTRQPFFETTFDVASTVPGAEQPGLSVTVSADRGDGARMTWMRIFDASGGLGMEFSDYQYPNAAFTYTTFASGLDRSQPHTVRMTTALIDGPADPTGTANDIVCVFVDGVLMHQGTSWESYHLNWGGRSTVTVDSLLFRTAGTAAPATAGKGFLIDNLSQSTGPIPAGFETGCTPSTTPAPTPVPGASAQPAGEPLPLCALYGGGTNAIVRADAQPNQFCRILVENREYKQDGAEVGDINLINAGIHQAVDIFAFAAGGERITIFDRPLTVCLQGTGQFWYRDATGQPRTSALLPGMQTGDYTCATVNHAGTAVLVGP
ncbi:MAG TPA: hypothetical protein VER79_03260 [Candidatus Limnocylindrales bacterium]|nr:hypothetical protein [Candidatus Limnocylindrales bacterium]